jgi:hypothetical protein
MVWHQAVVLLGDDCHTSEVFDLESLMAVADARWSGVAVLLLLLPLLQVLLLVLLLVSDVDAQPIGSRCAISMTQVPA